MNLIIQLMQTFKKLINFLSQYFKILQVEHHFSNYLLLKASMKSFNVTS